MAALTGEAALTVAINEKWVPAVGEAPLVVELDEPVVDIDLPAPGPGRLAGAGEIGRAHV